MGGFISCLVTGDQTMYRFAKDKKRKDKITCLEMGGFISLLVTGDQTMYRFAKDKKRKDKITSIFIGMFFLDTFESV